MTDRHAVVGEQIAALRTMFVSTDRFGTLLEQFERLFQRRKAEIEKGLVAEARGIAVIGCSGSGKTTAIDRMISKHPDLRRENEGLERADVVAFRVPSPATLKFVGQTALTALGYPIQRERPAAIVWEMVRHHLRVRQTLFLHLDEAQDLLSIRSEREMQSVVATLKSLMQQKDWPVGLILSGMPELRDLLNFDPQLSRRFYPIAFDSISTISHGQEIIQTAAFYFNKVNLTPSEDVKSEDFPARLIHAAGDQFGIVIENIIGAIEEALLESASTIQRAHFATMFRRRTGCVDGMNPYVIDDFRAV